MRWKTNTYFFLMSRRVQFFLMWAFIAVVAAGFAMDRQAEVLGQTPVLESYYFANPDSALRLVQVRQWMEKKDFYDHTVARVNPAGGPVETPWTRPMDFLVAAGAWLAPDSYSLDQRLLLSAAWLPPLLVLATLLLLMKAAARKPLQNAALRSLIALCLYNLVGLNHFMPGNVDHHSLLILCWCGMLWMLLDDRVKYRAEILGFFMGLAFWVSPEAYLPIFFTYCVMCGLSLFDVREMRRVFAASVSLTLVLILGLCIEVRFGDYFSKVAYDTLSIVSVVFFGLVSVFSFLLAVIFEKNRNIWIRLLSGIASIVALATITTFFYPMFLKGPLAEIDPFIYEKYVPSIGDLYPISSVPFLFGHLFLPVLAMGILVIVARVKAKAHHRRQILVLSALLIISFMVNFIYIRFFYYAQIVSMLVIARFLPTCFGLWRGRVKTFDARWRAAIFLTLLTLVYFNGALSIAAAHKTQQFIPQKLRENNLCMARLAFMLETGQLQKWIGEKPQTIVGPEFASTTLLFFSPHGLITAKYHREGEGIRVLHAIETAKTEEEARPLLKKNNVGALFYCPGLYEENTWLFNLARNIPPAWVKRVPIPGADDGVSYPHLYKVQVK